MTEAGSPASGAVLPAVRFRDVSVTFPRSDRAVLAGVTITIDPGERVVVFGPSGAGKSTLLATITGVVPHSVIAEVGGTVTVGGLDTLSTEVVDLSRLLGVLPQDPDSAVCLPGVEQELALVLENRFVPPAEISARIDGALASAGAAELRGRATGTLSGGESQRVALAAALIGRPQILVLDEPTSMLDADGMRQVRDAVDAAARPGTVAVLLVEHRLDEYAGSRGLAGLPERCIVLGADGRVRHDGPTASVLPAAAAELHRAGCWLPCETELQAALGISGGLAEPAVQQALLALAEPTTEPTTEPRTAVTVAHADFCVPHTGRRSPLREQWSVAPALAEPVAAHGPVVLAGQDLAVSRDPAGRPARAGRFRRVRAAAARRVLLHGVNVELHAGEIVAVLGRNGAGKSSLLLTLAGLLAPAGGTVTGERPGMVFQNPEHQFLGSTVREEVGYGLPADATPRVRRMLHAHGLGHLAAQNPYRLSGGQKRRVSLAAMLAHDRPSLLADEPTLGLDRRATIATIAAFRAAAAAGTGILLSSHDLRTVATLADRVLVVADGRIVADGPVFEVLREEQLLAGAGVTVPPLVGWLLSRLGDGDRVRRVLDALDVSVDAGADAWADAWADAAADASVDAPVETAAFAAADAGAGAEASAEASVASAGRTR
jgi:energy-coupling factor transporter ATP-binding protein EcfA2